VAAAAAAAVAAAGSVLASPPLRGARERELLDAVGQLGDANEVLNERAVAVMKRMSSKLTGRDGQPPGEQPVVDLAGPADSIETQVHRLICQAKSSEALCQAYIGWCSFW